MRKLLFLLLLSPLFSHAQIISTFAGIDSSGYSGDGGPATLARLKEPLGVATDRAGNVYIADYPGERIRKVNAAGIITTIAGNGSMGHSGDGGPATAAEIYSPLSVSTDASGNVYFAEWGTGDIRKINSAGIISTVAGGGTSAADGVPATTAILGAYDVAVDNAGNMYIADQNHARIRMVNTSGNIYTIAGNGILAHSGDGGPATAAELISPLSITPDAAGNIYFVDDNCIREISTSGIITSLTGSTTGYGGDGGPATAAQLNAPHGIAVDALGNVYFGDRGNNVVRKINAWGIISTVAGDNALGGGFSGDGGPATAARLAQPMGVSLDTAGNLYIGDAANSVVRRVTGISAGIKVVSPAASKVQMFPNPAFGTFSIVAQDAISSIAIANATGTEVLRRSASANAAEVNIAALPPGLYFVTVNGAFAGRMVKE